MTRDAFAPGAHNEVLEILFAFHHACAAALIGDRAICAAVPPCPRPIQWHRGGGRFAITRLDSAQHALFYHLDRQAVQRGLEGIAGINAIAVDPGFTRLPVQVVTQQHLIQLQDVRVLREHNVTGIVEGKTLIVNRAAPAARRGIFLQ